MINRSIFVFVSLAQPPPLSDRLEKVLQGTKIPATRSNDVHHRLPERDGRRFESKVINLRAIRSTSFLLDIRHSESEKPQPQSASCTWRLSLPHLCACRFWLNQRSASAGAPATDRGSVLGFAPASPGCLLMMMRGWLIAAKKKHFVIMTADWRQSWSAYLMHIAMCGGQMFFGHKPTVQRRMTRSRWLGNRSRNISRRYCK